MALALAVVPSYSGQAYTWNRDGHPPWKTASDVFQVSGITADGQPQKWGMGRRRGWRELLMQVCRGQPEPWEHAMILGRMFEAQVANFPRDGPA